MRRLLLVGSLVLAALALARWSGRARSPEADIGPPSPGEQVPLTAAEVRSAASAPQPETMPSGSREPLAPSADPGGTARLAGRLLDASTEEVVPGYQLRLKDRDGIETQITSDAGGRFTTGEALAFGAVRIELVDCAGQPRPGESRRGSARVEHTGQPMDLRIDVGPTYLVDVDLPETLGFADLGVRLLQDPPDLEPERVEAETGRTLLRTPLGDWPHPWARFRSTHPGRPQPQWLELTSADGLWSGGARVPSGPGVHREPVRITLRPVCAVRGRYVADSPPARGGGALALFREGEPEPRWEHADGAGRFRIAGLEPGAYRLEVRDESVRAEPVRFVLRPGENDLGELPWTPIPLAGRVRLRLWSDVRVPVDVELVRSFDPPKHAPWHSDRWEPRPEGGFESLFEWDEVYAGTFEVVVHSHELGAWHLALGELEPPVEDFLFHLPKPRPAIELRVLDDATGAELDDYTVLVRAERGWEELEGSPRSLPFVVWDEGSAFAVHHSGHRAWIGSPGLAGQGGARVEVRLSPGWSHLFLARTRGRGRPLADVEVRLDGVAAGRSDARGELWVHATAPAQVLDVAHATLTWTEERWTPLEDCVTWLELHP
ncbi:MAG TPA: hypothetical protein VF530_01295 [Planctomycetota bacterium]